MYSTQVGAQSLTAALLAAFVLIGIPLVGGFL